VSDGSDPWCVKLGDWQRLVRVEPAPSDLVSVEKKFESRTKFRLWEDDIPLTFRRRDYPKRQMAMISQHISDMIDDALYEVDDPRDYVIEMRNAGWASEWRDFIRREDEEIRCAVCHHDLDITRRRLVDGVFNMNKFHKVVWSQYHDWGDELQTQLDENDNTFRHMDGSYGHPHLHIVPGSMLKILGQWCTPMDIRVVKPMINVMIVLSSGEGSLDRLFEVPLPMTRCYGQLSPFAKHLYLVYMLSLYLCGAPKVFGKKGAKFIWTNGHLVKIPSSVQNWLLDNINQRRVPVHPSSAKRYRKIGAKCFDDRRIQIVQAEIGVPIVFNEYEI
jgi:hypothetical protein